MIGLASVVVLSVCIVIVVLFLNFDVVSGIKPINGNIKLQM